MDIVQIVRNYKVPYKFLAQEMNLNENTFRQKMNGYSEFSNEQIELLRQAVEKYTTEVSLKLKLAA